METVTQLGIFLFGLCFFVWGSLIVFSRKFREFWERRYWKGPLTWMTESEAGYYSRYVTGLGTMLLGLGIMAILIFMVWT